MTFIFLSVRAWRSVRAADVLGVFVGFGGSLIILKLWEMDLNSLLLSGNLFFMLGAALWSGVTINSQKTQSNMSIWVYSFYLNGFSLIIQAFFTAPHGFSGLLVPDPLFWLYMIYLTLISAVFATSIYFYAAMQIGSHKASAFTFLVPISAVVLSWLFLGEVPEISTLCGGVLSVGAVYLIQHRGI
jgi:drug/metabolite transporter (DMT)-like permease